MKKSERPGGRKAVMRLKTRLPIPKRSPPFQVFQLLCILSDLYLPSGTLGARQTRFDPGCHLLNLFKGKSEYNTCLSRSLSLSLCSVCQPDLDSLRRLKCRPIPGQDLALGSQPFRTTNLPSLILHLSTSRPQTQPWPHLYRHCRTLDSGRWRISN